jgi:hypothetical protein
MRREERIQLRRVCKQWKEWIEEKLDTFPGLIIFLIIFLVPKQEYFILHKGWKKKRFETFIKSNISHKFQPLIGMLQISPHKTVAILDPISNNILFKTTFPSLYGELITGMNGTKLVVFDSEGFRNPANLDVTDLLDKPNAVHFYEFLPRKDNKPLAVVSHSTWIAEVRVKLLYLGDICLFETDYAKSLLLIDFKSGELLTILGISTKGILKVGYFGFEYPMIIGIDYSTEGFTSIYLMRAGANVAEVEKVFAGFFDCVNRLSNDKDVIIWDSDLRTIIVLDCSTLNILTTSTLIPELERSPSVKSFGEGYISYGSRVYNVYTGSAIRMAKVEIGSKPLAILPWVHCIVYRTSKQLVVMSTYDGAVRWEMDAYILDAVVTPLMISTSNFIMTPLMKEEDDI